MSSVAFKSGSKSKRNQNLRKSTLSFDTEEQLEQPSPSPPPSAFEEHKEGEDEELAAIRAERQKRKEKGKAVGGESRGDKAVRRAVRNIRVGDDFQSPTREEREGSHAGGGMYSKEALAELRNNAIHIGHSSPSPPPPLPPSLPLPSDDDDPSPSPAQQLLIRKAKTQRARQRAMTDLTDDYIPLPSSRPPPLTPSSPLIVDDDADDHPTLLREAEEDDVIDMTNEAREVEGEDRLLFGDEGRVKRKEKQRKDMEIILEEDKEEEEADSEMEEWEAEQLKKGGVKIRQREREANPSPLPVSIDRRAADPSQPSLSTLSYPSLLSSLTSHLSSLRATHSSTLSHASSLSSRLTRLRSSQSDVARKAEEVEEAFLFYQDMRQWMASLLGMLAEKVEDVDEAWEEWGRMRQRRGGMREERRRQRTRDEEEEANGEGGGGGEVQEVDEFGRDLGYVREVDRERRDKMRAKVRQLIQQQKVKRKDGEATVREGVDQELDSLSLLLDGWESEGEYYEEAEGLSSTLSSSLSAFHNDVRGILSDVEVEWREVQTVAGHLQHWKQRYPTAYHDAYIAHSLPKLFAPFVRIEMMQTDPLSSSLSSFEWHRVLSSYGKGQEGRGEEDPDVHLMGQLLLAVVCPVLVGVVRDEWDVTSEREGRRVKENLMELEEQLKGEGERGIKAMHEIRQAVRERWKREVEMQGEISRKSREEAVRLVCMRRLKLLYCMTEWEEASELIERQVKKVIQVALLMIEGITEEGAELEWQVVNMVSAVLRKLGSSRLRRSARWLHLSEAGQWETEKLSKDALARLQRGWREVISNNNHNHNSFNSSLSDMDE